MRKLLFLAFTIIYCQLSIINSFAQSPEKINYQGVARDNSGNVLASDAIGLRITIRSGSGSGTIVYRETHSVTTNAFGLFNIQIGGGTIVSGTLSGIDWAANTYYVETEMDPAGTSYTSLGAQQLVSVPYALYAKKAANVSGTTNYIPKFTPNGTTLGNSRIFDTGNYTGIGTAFPVWDLDLHNPTGSQTMFHITNTTTGIMEGDGLTLGLVSASGDATLTNGESGKYLSFGTNGTERIRIDPSGYVGVGTTAPQWNMQVNSAGSETVLQLTAGLSTGSFDLDGLLIGVNGSGAHFSNMENTGMYLGNNSTGGINIADDGNVGIGTSTPAYLLHIPSTDNTVAYFRSTYPSGNNAGTIESECTTASSDQRGVVGRNNTTSYYGVGVEGIGGYIGVRGDASVTGANQRFGVYGVAGNSSGLNYGIYGTTVGTSGTYYAGYFAGNVYTSGSYLPSDKSLKTDVSAFDNALAVVTKIPVKQYHYKQDGIYGKMNLPQGNQVGIMADELQQIMPNLVLKSGFEDTEAYFKGEVSKENIPSVEFNAVNYTGLVPVMIKGMQEQQQIIEALKAEMETLKKEVQSLKK
ncbi:MAG: hypothetical protein POELPBGB_02523 [Bacteroidia bacterium]|nr:hypothetical protein [Bacteroidia bacterium]